ncbi:hypothetical protein S83_048349 [Arachis hypogaea]
MVSRELFGWSPPHIQPLTPVSEVSEPPESPSLYIDAGAETSASQQVEVEEEIIGQDAQFHTFKEGASKPQFRLGQHWHSPLHLLISEVRE